MIQAIKAKIILTPGHAPIKDSAVIVKNNIIEKIIPSTELKNNYYQIIDLKISASKPSITKKSAWTVMRFLYLKLLSFVAISQPLPHSANFYLIIRLD